MIFSKKLSILFFSMLTCVGLFFTQTVFAIKGELRVEIPYDQGFTDIVSDDSVITPLAAEDSFLKLVRLINTYLWLIVGVVMVVALMYAGMLLITSRGQEESFKKGLKIVLYAVIGLGVAILSYVIINLVVNLFA